MLLIILFKPDSFAPTLKLHEVFDLLSCDVGGELLNGIERMCLWDENECFRVGSGFAGKLVESD